MTAMQTNALFSSTKQYVNKRFLVDRRLSDDISGRKQLVYSAARFTVAGNVHRRRTSGQRACSVEMRAMLAK
jgi:hypothetical protein